MIDPAAMTTATLAPGTGAAIPATPGNPADSAVFADLLAAGETGLRAGGAAIAGAEAEPAFPATVVASRQLVADLPATGNLLPAGLAGPEAGSALAVPDQQPAASAPGIPVPALPLLRAIRPIQDQQQENADGKATGPDGEAAEADSSPPAVPLTVTALIVPFAVAPLAPPARMAAASAPAKPAPRSDAAQPGAPSGLSLAGLLPPAIAAQVLGRPLPRHGQAMVAGETPENLPSTIAAAPQSKLALPGNPAGPQPEFSLASAAAPAATAAAALHLRPVVERALKPEAATDTGALALPAGTPDMAAAPAAPATTPSLRTPGHDFGAVVDRLMAARDAVASGGPAQPVALAVRHVEFGEVSVRFEQRGGGLSVALASPDPDFARAVQAAVPAGNGGDATASGSFTGGTFAGSAQGATLSQQGPAQNGSSGNSGQRSQAGNPGQPDRASHAATSGRSTDTETPTRPRGIYA